MSVKKSKTTTKRSLTAVEYERLGRDIESVVMSGTMNKGRLLAMNFLKGVATGVGALVGATIIVALLLWLLSVLGEIPFIGDVFENLRETIKENPEV